MVAVVTETSLAILEIVFCGWISAIFLDHPKTILISLYTSDYEILQQFLNTFKVFYGLMPKIPQLTRQHSFKWSGYALGWR
jgi:hypothetical protein